MMTTMPATSAAGRRSNTGKAPSLGRQEREQRMGTFLMGLIFLYVDIRVYTVSILPAFVGYLLLLSGMRSVPS